MKLYIFLIILANVVIDVINILFVEIAWYVIVAFTALSTIVAFIIDLILAVVIRRLPEKWFNPQKKIFEIFNFEKREIVQKTEEIREKIIPLLFFIRLRRKTRRGGRGLSGNPRLTNESRTRVRRARKRG